MQFDHVIFDIDGTMADTLDLCVEVFQITLAWINQRPYTREEILNHFGVRDEEIMRRMVAPEVYEQALEQYYAVFDSLQGKQNQPFPNIRRLLNRLHKAGVDLAVVTGKGPVTAEITLRHLGLAAYFDSVECGSLESKTKVVSLRKTLDTLQADPERTLYVGDVRQDMQDAMDCGMWGAGAAWATTATLKQDDWNGRVRVFESIDALEDWLFL